jgi:hypothetical protein
MTTAPCECGCGQPTPPATRTNPKRGTIEGQPTRFLPGHHRRAQTGPLDEPVRRHLADHPGVLLSAYEITRALGLGDTRIWGVKGALRRLQTAGEVEAVTTPKAAYDARPTTRWRQP